MQVKAVLHDSLSPFDETGVGDVAQVLGHDSLQRAMIRVDREPVHAEQVERTLFNGAHDGQKFELDGSVVFLVIGECKTATLNEARGPVLVVL